MNLFFSKLTGSLYSTDKMEREILRQEEELARYRRIEQSDELQEYNSLKQTVSSKEFEQKKYNLMRTKYKATSVYQTMHEYEQLRDNKTLQLYLKVVESTMLKDYLAFRNSDNYIKLQSKQEIRNSLELKQMADFEKSKEYKAYLTYKDSNLPQKYEKLREEISTQEFKQEQVFWSNPKRWTTTEEYQQEKRLKELTANADIRFYLSQDPKKMEETERYLTTFADDFQWLKFGESKWKAGFAYKNKQLLSIHSFVNEQQANNGGKNVGSIDGKLKLFTKNEKVMASAWDAKKGFVKKEYNYTSDVIQTADSFRQQEGIFMAKIRITGHIHHAFWLGSDGKLPLISIFHYNGKKITIGVYNDKAFDGTTIAGISATDYYIYSLRWTKNELIWYINNKEVYRTGRNIPTEQLYLAFSSFIDAQQKAQEAEMNVAWVKVYSYSNK